MNNIEFMKLMFANAASGACPWVTSFSVAPGDATPRDWCGWPVKHAGRVPGGLSRNAYVAVSTFNAFEGRYRRRKANFSALHCVMVDDIGVKVAESAIALPFTLEVETSPGNRQGWYRIDPPVTDRAMAERLIERMVSAGLTADGKDPGMKGVTRYGRLPEGSNNKPAVVARFGAPWRHLVTEHRPHVAYSVDEVAEAYELDLSPPPLRPVRRRLVASDECQSVLDWLRAAGLYQQALGNGWHAITCPWAAEHSNGVTSGTGYSEPSPDNRFVGGFKCHHGHCEHRDIGHLLTFIDLLARCARKGRREHV